MVSRFPSEMPILLGFKYHIRQSYKIYLCIMQTLTGLDERKMTKISLVWKQFLKATCRADISFSLYSNHAFAKNNAYYMVLPFAQPYFQTRTPLSDLP